MAASLPVGIYLTDTSWNCLYVNERWCELTGLSPEEAIGEEWIQPIHPDDRGRIISSCIKMLDSEGIWEGEYRLLNKNGGVIWVQGIVKAMRDADGRITVYFGTQADITNYKQTIEQLRKSEEKFRAIADYATDWEYWVEPQGDYLYISPAVQRLTGYDAEQMAAEPELLFTIIHPDDRKFFRKHLAEEFHQREPFQFDFRIIRNDEELRWISHECQPIFNSTGDFLGRRVSNRDITRQKLAEEQLVASEQRFRLALDASSDGLWDRDLLTNEVYYGENWHRVLGYTDEDAKAKEFSWKKLLHPEDREKAFAAIQEHFEGRKERYETEFRMLNKKGEWQWFLSRGKVVAKDEMGRPLRFVGTHTDITKSKNYEFELQATRDNLEKMVKKRTAELEETNVALKVLLKRREKDKTELEQSILKNVASLIEPYMDRLAKTNLNESQYAIVEVLKANLAELTSSFSRSFAARWGKFTPAEIQIANLIKNGKSTKEIADLINASPGTVNIHRKNIRKKLGLTNEKANLQTVLSSFSQGS
jgi:PAS domain S-box-containing protein